MIVSLVEGVYIAIVVSFSYRHLARVLHRKITREWLVRLCALGLGVIVTAVPVVLVEAVVRRFVYDVPWVAWAFWVGFLPTYMVTNVRNS